MDVSKIRNFRESYSFLLGHVFSDGETFGCWLAGIVDHFCFGGKTGNKYLVNISCIGFLVLYSQITETLNYLVRIASEVETNIVSVERIREYTQAPQEAPWDNPDVQITPTWPDKGIVEFRRFGVKYRPGLDLVLSNVSFQTKENEKIGIVGRTGAGKSSLTLSLFRWDIYNIIKYY